MTREQKLQAITELVARWQAGGISDSAAMLVVADIVAPVPVTAADLKWGQEKLQDIQEYDPWR